MSKESMRAKMRASHRARLDAETPEQKALRSAKLTEAANRPEVKAKHAAIVAARRLSRNFAL